MPSVMIDTNILVSAFWRIGSSHWKFIHLDRASLTIFLTPYIIGELRDTIRHKFPQVTSIVEEYIRDGNYKLSIVSDEWNETMPAIRDKKDRPILAAAINADVDFLVTGDKDFLAIADQLDHPRIVLLIELMQILSHLE
ncbi:MAG: putative toxin-antitoxin system toxin component, PIN family [Thermoguttaceae bacterium]